MRRPRVLAAIAVGGLGFAVWLFLWKFDQAPYPYASRWLLNIPLPWLTNRRLVATLDPQPGEFLLEVGPGTGLQTMAIAPLVGPSGRLAIVDIQPEMLTHTVARTRRRGLTAVSPVQCDAMSLPFPDNSVDGAYMVTALGEIPDPVAALNEIYRILKPNGRLVIGEWVPDPHGISSTQLVAWQEAIGYRSHRATGPRWAYFALARKP